MLGGGGGCGGSGYPGSPECVASEVRVLERETVGDTVVVELLTDGIEGKLTLSRAGGRWQITSFAE